MKKIVVFVYLFSIVCLSKTEIYQKNGTKHIFEIYSEEGREILDYFQLENGYFQTKVSSSTFSSKFDLYEYLKKLQYDLKIDSAKKLSKSSKVLFDKHIQTEVKNTAVWVVRNQWNLDWENKFADWVADNFDTEFFERYSIKTDCADAAIALRWIFARIYGLPAANTLAGTGALFTNESMLQKWSGVAKHKIWYKDKLFLKALDYIKDNAYTRTLHRDTYPISISKESLLEGTIQLLGGHTRIVSEINYSGKKAPIVVLSSTVPTRVRKLYKEMLTNSKNVEIKAGGILRMRWPYKKSGRWYLRRKKNMPLYSESQYSDEFRGEKDNFTLAIIEKLEIKLEEEGLVNSIVKQILDSLMERKSVVEDGYKYCSERECEEGGLDYEDWSTPSRDKRLKETYTDGDSLIRKFSSFFPLIRKTYAERLDKTEVEISGVAYSLNSIYEKIKKGWLSHHPKDSVGERWGATTEAAFTFLNKRTKRLLQKREEIVSGAELCRSVPLDCDPKSKQWDKYWSGEVDRSIVFASKGISEICLLEDFECEPESLDGLARYSFFHSNPTLSEKKRWGEEREFESEGVLPFGDSFHEIFSGVLRTGKSIYSLKTGTKLFDQVGCVYKLSNEGNILVCKGEEVFSLSQEMDLTPLLKEGRKLVSVKKVEREAGVEFYVSWKDGDKLGISIFKDDESGLTFIAELSNYKLLRRFEDKKSLIFKKDNFLYIQDYSNGNKKILLSDTKSSFIDDVRILSDRYIRINFKEDESKLSFRVYDLEKESFLPWIMKRIAFSSDIGVVFQEDKGGPLYWGSFSRKKKSLVLESTKFYTNFKLEFDKRILRRSSYVEGKWEHAYFDLKENKDITSKMIQDGKVLYRENKNYYVLEHFKKKECRILEVTENFSDKKIIFSEKSEKCILRNVSYLFTSKVGTFHRVENGEVTSHEIPTDKDYSSFYSKNNIAKFCKKDVGCDLLDMKSKKIIFSSKNDYYIQETDKEMSFIKHKVTQDLYQTYSYDSNSKAFALEFSSSNNPRVRVIRGTGQKKFAFGSIWNFYTFRQFY